MCGLHRVLATALRAGAEVSRVAEHFSQRNESVDLLRAAAGLTESFSSSDFSTVAPCSDIIRYRYKEENGKVYRRLYNYTRGEWAEDSWHLVG